MMMKTLLAVSVLALGLTSFVGLAADSAHVQKVTQPVAMQSDDMAVKHEVASERGKSHKAAEPVYNFDSSRPDYPYREPV